MSLSILGKTILFGKPLAKRITSEGSSVNSVLKIYFHMIMICIKYGIDAQTYYNNRLDNLNGEELKRTCCELKKISDGRKDWGKIYHSNWRFLSKWTKEKYSSKSYLSYLRGKAYVKHYHLSNKPIIQYGVQIICEHSCVGRLDIGKNVLFARNVDIDYTGDLTIGNNVMLSENTKILTHDHSFLLGHDTIITPLVIQDEVRLGARVIVLPGVKEIGRGSFVTAGSVVKHAVPPYSIVMGNPARVVGFRFNPEQTIEYEEDRYSPQDRMSIEQVELNYRKFYLDRINEIQSFIRY